MNIKISYRTYCKRIIGGKFLWKHFRMTPSFQQSGQKVGELFGFINVYLK